MARRFPSRYEPYEEALNRQIANAADRVVSSLTEPAGGNKRQYTWQWAIGTGILCMIIFLREHIAPAPARGVGSNSAPLVSAGVGAVEPQVRDLIPLPRVQGTDDKLVRSMPEGHDIAPGNEKGAVLGKSEGVLAMEVLFDERTPPPLRVPAAEALEQAEAPVINMGSTLAATLSESVTTGELPTPVAAVTTADVRAGDKVLVESGARLIGEALASQVDNRVQIAFVALVVGGRTIRFSGVARREDTAPGLKARVVQKGQTQMSRWSEILNGARSIGVAELAQSGNDWLFQLGAQSGAIAAARLAAPGRGRPRVLLAPAGDITVFVRSDVVLK